MRRKNLKYTGLMLAGVIIIISFVYAVNIQPVVIGDLNNFSSSFSKLKTFGSYRELTEFLNNRQSGYQSNYWDLEPRMFIAMEDGFSSSDSMLVAKSNGGMVVDYSQTNVQVIGVDEPDIVKTDGEYLYIVSQNKVIIVKARPAENATIECEIVVNSSLTIINIFISGSRLVIFAEDYDYPIFKESMLEPLVLDVDEVSKSVAEVGLTRLRWYSSPDTHLEIYDLSDFENPELVRDIVVPGHFSGARMIDDFVYLITTQNQYEILYLDGNETIVPRILVNGQVQVVELDDISYVDIPEETSTITNIVSVNVHDDDDEVNSKMFLLGYTQVLYVSRDNIYVAYSTSYYNYDMLQSVIEEVIIPILPGDVKQEIELVGALKNLNEYQKKTVTEWILQNFTNSLSEDEQIELYREINRRLERTTIHRINIKDGEIEYKAQGEIPGRISDQFQLSEHGGHLRVSSIIEGNMIRGFFSNIQTMNNIYERK